ncbi:TetR family transcriptional regulator [Myxococcus stipitatus DSM 14675]|uniref:TetR family transcriptional regulator n=1 Tax=Myxococcus stipitatus (strain DSM 14675 / JCM 12634 / Mx s8) TaxID=1278073 RepID=L7UBA9_MYXSD|nr:TetR/AcrR family transcriptional regulator [Myxococcus stipitatus]AGC45338.1 TetR family transcriptional regulator [Myxococcus stipitatus DSM 14675]
MSTSSKGGYHHGDLRAALLEAAMQMLEEGEPFSLRAVARRAGVSPTAPYRHFADREALESALATEGFRELKARLTEGRALPASASELAELGVAYVHFALERPALFRLMFGQPCSDTHDERVQAASELRDLLALLLAHIFPEADAPSLATAAWGLVHGLAFLHLDGKLPATPRKDVAIRVRTAFEAILSANAPRR